MPEVTAEQMSTFISWCYTGLLESSLCAEELWVLGDLLQSPEFANEAMYCLFDQHEADLIRAQSAHYAYTHAAKGCRLRDYIKSAIAYEGPLRLTVETLGKDREDWCRLIRHGGDLVLDIALIGASFSSIPNYELSNCEAPYGSANRSAYMLACTVSAVEDFIKSKLQSD